MRLLPIRSIAGLVAAILALTGSAYAQLQLFGGPSYTDIDLGDREAGKSYPLALAVQNRNCSQPLDFRFTSKTPWLVMPADPVVRQVSAGQQRQIEANLDLTDVTPGERQAFVDVDCENCGFFVFKNCKIDKQQLRILINVSAAPAPPQGQQVQADQAQEPPQIDYDDERIPKHLRKKAKAAYADWESKLKRKKPCDEELAKLRAAAAAADEAADKARRAAETAEQDARNARAQEEAAQEELKKANKEAGDAAEALKKAEAARNAASRGASTQAERDAAKAAVEKAKADKEAADKRVSDAANAAGLHSAGDLADMDKDAKKKRAAADKAAGAANDAHAAASAKEKECEKLQAEADAAKAAKDKAEQDAKDAIPPAASNIPTPEQIEAQRKKLRDCADKLGKLLEAQRLALEAMARYGGLGENYESDLESWAKAVDKVNDLFDKVPPGIPIVSEMVGTVQDALTAVRAIIGIASGVSNTGNLYHVPKNGNDVVNPGATQAKLQKDGLASSPEEAKDVYEQMKRYSETGSTEKMQQDLEAARAHCKAEEEKLDQMEKAAKGK